MRAFEYENNNSFISLFLLLPLRGILVFICSYILWTLACAFIDFICSTVLSAVEAEYVWTEYSLIFQPVFRKEKIEL